MYRNSRESAEGGRGPGLQECRRATLGKDPRCVCTRPLAQAAAQGTLVGRVTTAGRERAGRRRPDGNRSRPARIYSVVVNRGGYQTSQTDDVAVVTGSGVRC